MQSPSQNELTTERQRVERTWIHWSAASLGHTSEIFEGDAAHLPVGRTAQEWSVAKVLRAAVEDTYGIRPQQSPEPLETGTQLPREPQAAS